MFFPFSLFPPSHARLNLKRAKQLRRKKGRCKELQTVMLRRRMITDEHLLGEEFFLLQLKAKFSAIFGVKQLHFFLSFTIVSARYYIQLSFKMCVRCHRRIFPSFHTINNFTSQSAKLSFAIIIFSFSRDSRLQLSSAEKK